MLDSAWSEILLVLALILINGALAMSELAIVSSRAARLKTLQTQGVPGAGTALSLASDPGKFLSAVQVGITLVGVLSGAISGATLGVRLKGPLMTLGLSEKVAEPLAFGLVVAVITFISLIIGELVPKQIALRDPERIACRVAPAMAVIARFSSPAVWFLDRAGRFVMRLLGLRDEGQSNVTEEEIRTLVAEAESAGVLEPEEHQMITGVLRLADRPVATVMTPRTEVDMIDLREDDAVIRKALVASVHSRLVVHNGNPDEIVGVIQAKDLADALLKGRRFRMKSLVKTAPVIPETMDALDVVEVLKNSGIHMGLVHDEYGHFLGVVTSADILEAIVGEFETEAGPAEPDAVERPDGSWLISGTMPADEFAERMGLTLPPRRDYRTVGGLVLELAGRIPSVGEVFPFQHWQIEVVDLDGRRIDKVLASRRP
ncbi:MAG: hemolysin family protein [Hyphomicrobiales bacterium]